jgi:hypothetical protein
MLDLKLELKLQTCTLIPNKYINTHNLNIRNEFTLKF